MADSNSAEFAEELITADTVNINTVAITPASPKPLDERFMIFSIIIYEACYLRFKRLKITQ